MDLISKKHPQENYTSLQSVHLNRSDHYHTGISNNCNEGLVLMCANSYVSFAVSTYVQGWKLTQCYNTSLTSSSDLVHQVHVVMDTTSLIRSPHQRKIINVRKLIDLGKSFKFTKVWYRNQKKTHKAHFAGSYCAFTLKWTQRRV